jgi:hypothetical protein
METVAVLIFDQYIKRMISLAEGDVECCFLIDLLADGKGAAIELSGDFGIQLVPSEEAAEDMTEPGYGLEDDPVTQLYERMVALTVIDQKARDFAMELTNYGYFTVQLPALTLNTAVGRQFSKPEESTNGFIKTMKTLGFPDPDLK